MTSDGEAEEDERRLAQNKRDIDEVLRLIEEGVHHTEAAQRVSEAQARVDARQQGRVFHPHQGRRIPLPHDTSSTLQLAEALELHIRARRHGDLHKTLGRLSRERVRLLRRVLDRGGI